MAENQQVVLHEGSDVEEIPRPEPQQHIWALPPVIVNTTPWRRYAAFTILAAFDIAMNAAAGASAATVGARLNKRPLNAQVIRLGALAGMTKAIILSFRQMVDMAKVNFVFRMLMLVVFSSFGICLVLTAEVCNILLEKTPKELLVAAVVAAIPLTFESVREIEPKPDEEGHTDLFMRPILSVFLIASNTLGGYVFARMASNQGMPISNYPAACSAGAAFGTITFLARAITACVTCMQYSDDGVTYSAFGKYEWIEPEPIVLTEEEYQRMCRAFERAQGNIFKRAFSISSRMDSMRKFGLKVLARLACCIPVPGVERKELQKKLRTKAQEPSEFTQDFAELSRELGDMSLGSRPAAVV